MYDFFMARPREFDPKDALDKVTQLFWRQGYRVTSYGDLMKATHLSKQSIYCAFGDKRELFLKSLRHYREQTAAALEGMDRGQKSFPDLLYQMMTYAAFRSESSKLPQGCLAANTTLELKNSDAGILRELDAINDLLLRSFAKVLREGQKKHQVTTEISSETLARFLLNTLNGIRILERTARSKKEIQSVIDVALRSIV
jgi:TetR/AcrR family transcriptional regulator, transcriptional repressor for nem operon